MSANFLVQPKSVAHNPDPKDLRQWVSEMPNAKLTEFDNYMVQTKVLARSKASTFIVDDDADAHSDPTISRAKYDEIAALQDEHIKTLDMIVIDGFIGPDPETRTAARLYMDKRNANIAAMQRQLYFSPTAAEYETFEPTLNIVYTPNLPMPGFPNDRLIAVDLNNGITRVMNSDYFGESKKAGLRMWNDLVYRKGGLSLHAGCKEIPVKGERKICLIIGLSGTGKTTTTFTRQLGSKPIQDDFIGWLPDGAVIGSEDGCFAKTIGLDPEAEPMIHHAVTQAGAYLENVAVGDDGKVDFFDGSYTENGRATFPLDLIPEPGDVHDIPKVDFVLILNRNDNIIPAVARLRKDQAAAFFMLGETQGTSAGGVEEAGKALRVPGTNPFFPGLHGQQGTRFLQLVERSNAEVFLMNTGWVGGTKDSKESRKVKIRHSSAIVQAIAEGTITWAPDADFGYEIASALPGISGQDEALLNPREYYLRSERTEQYEKIVAQLKADRRTHLQKYEGLDTEIAQAV